MPRLNFTKMVASGNDFVVIDKKPAGSLPGLARRLCDRKFGAGADGLLLVEKSKKTDLRMRIINADGSEAEMCGNGARCAALFSGKKVLKISTLAGVIDARVYGGQAKIRLTDAETIKLDIPIMLCGRPVKASFINTGVPHAVIFVEGLDALDVDGIGSMVRRHARFSPAGANVNFVEAAGNNIIRVRTFERGVEGETLACGTGSSASALIFALKSNLNSPVKVETKSGEILKVYFKKEADRFSDIWLQGSARIVYKGEYYV